MSYKKRVPFFGTEKASDLMNALVELSANPLYETPDFYAADLAKYPKHRMTFVEKHMAYIDAHPNVDLQHYIANLKLVTKRR